MRQTINKPCKTSPRVLVSLCKLYQFLCQAKLVKLADKLYNLRDLERATPQGWSPERKQEYFVWAAKVIISINNSCLNMCLQVVLGLRGSNKIIEDQLDEVLIRNGVENPSKIQLVETEIKE